MPNACLVVVAGLHMNSDLEDVARMILNGELSRDDVRLFTGYCGWGPNQLRSEIEMGTWSILRGHSEDLIMQALVGDPSLNLPFIGGESSGDGSDGGDGGDGGDGSDSKAGDGTPPSKDVDSPDISTAQAQKSSPRAGDGGDAQCNLSSNGNNVVAAAREPEGEWEEMDPRQWEFVLGKRRAFDERFNHPAAWAVSDGFSSGKHSGENEAVTAEDLMVLMSLESSAPGFDEDDEIDEYQGQAGLVTGDDNDGFTEEDDDMLDDDGDDDDDDDDDFEGTDFLGFRGHGDLDDDGTIGLPHGRRPFNY